MVDLNSLPDSFFDDGTHRDPRLANNLKSYTDVQLMEIQLRQINELIIQVQKKPKPTYDIDGQKVSWTEYLQALHKMRDDLHTSIVNAEGPAEEEMWGWT